jgi:serine phosphatase RsbU (regulator of sigma subunit)
VNQLFCENSSDSSYATLFFADYDDSSGRLRYVNCGHLPPLLLRADGQLERLSATATVLGLFEKWECSVAEVQLAAGDTMVLYTDGVTEAENVQDEQFGESRLIETMLAQRHLPVRSLLETIVETVQKFSEGEQADDITLVLARYRSQERKATGATSKVIRLCATICPDRTSPATILTAAARRRSTSECGDG